MEYQLIQDGIRIILHTDTNEGWNGEYDPADLDDQLLFRFDVDRLVDGVWEPIDDASYCTQLPGYLSTDQVEKALNFLASEIVEPAQSGFSIKKICERLSWINEDWI